MANAPIESPAYDWLIHLGVSSSGARQALAAEPISSPGDRRLVARLLQGAAHPPSLVPPVPPVPLPSV